jgi:hypothetical protein
MHGQQNIKPLFSSRQKHLLDYTLLINVEVVEVGESGCLQQCSSFNAHNIFRVLV